jgi:mRNA interferase MazF
MVPSATGAVILIPFPFSDLSQTKLRPAVVLASAGRGDWILCQVTSRPYADSAAVMLEQSSFATGSLQTVSYARPGKLFTAHESLFSSEAGRLEPSRFDRVHESVAAILRTGRLSIPRVGT